jgi:hypothetical protein
MPRSFRKCLGTFSEDELSDLRRRGAAEIANRNVREARRRGQATRRWSELAREAGVTERELNILVGGRTPGD